MVTWNIEENILGWKIFTLCVLSNNGDSWYLHSLSEKEGREVVKNLTAKTGDGTWEGGQREHKLFFFGRKIPEKPLGTRKGHTRKECDVRLN